MNSTYVERPLGQATQIWTNANNRENTLLAGLINGAFGYATAIPKVATGDAEAGIYYYYIELELKDGWPKFPEREAYYVGYINGALAMIREMRRVMGQSEDK